MAAVTCWGCGGSGCGECRSGKRFLYRCPGQELDGGAARVCGMFGMWEAGRFPVEGGILDQSASYWRAMQVLAGEVGRHRRERVNSHGS